MPLITHCFIGFLITFHFIYCHRTTEIVTGPRKIGLIYTKYICSYYGTYLQFCICYPKSVTFNEFLMDLYIYYDMLDTIQITNNELLYFTLSKLGQILHVDKTGFPRPSYN